LALAGVLALSPEIIILDESDMSLIDWEADWAGSAPAGISGFVVSALVTVAVIIFLVKRAKSSA
jgi:hypothetical protein